MVRVIEGRNVIAVQWVFLFYLVMVLINMTKQFLGVMLGTVGLGCLLGTRADLLNTSTKLLKYYYDEKKKKKNPNPPDLIKTKFHSKNFCYY